MSETSNSDPSSGAPTEQEGVLARLPRTRPQRASPRRVRAAVASGGDPSVKPPRKPARTGARKPPAKSSAGKASAKSSAGKASASFRAGKTTRVAAGKRTAKPAPAAEPVPPQGYEAEDDALRGPVRPPGGAELMASAAELAGELAKTGVHTGTRLVRDLLSRLPG